MFLIIFLINLVGAVITWRLLQDYNSWCGLLIFPALVDRLLTDGYSITKIIFVVVLYTLLFLPFLLLHFVVVSLMILAIILLAISLDVIDMTKKTK